MKLYLIIFLHLKKGKFKNFPPTLKLIGKHESFSHALKTNCFTLFFKNLLNKKNLTLNLTLKPKMDTTMPCLDVSISLKAKGFVFVSGMKFF